MHLWTAWHDSGSTQMGTSPWLAGLAASMVLLVMASGEGAGEARAMRGASARKRRIESIVICRSRSPNKRL
jgi:hypothetical protein